VSELVGNTIWHVVRPDVGLQYSKVYAVRRQIGTINNFAKCCI
jgi:hypothetical protein